MNINWNDPNTWPRWVQNDLRLAGPLSDLDQDEDEE